MVAKLKVEGTAEVLRAFDKVENEIKDLSKAHKAEAEMLLPDIRNATRKLSGELSSAWQSEGIATQAQFLNDVVYAGVQEFGWADHNIEPTNAIIQAFESNTDKTEAVYGDAIATIGRAAGFDTKS